MKQLVCASWIFLMALLLPACRSDRTPLISTQEIAVAVDPAIHSLSGTSSFNILPRGSKVPFRLADGSTVMSVTTGGAPVPFTFSGGTLVVAIPHHLVNREIKLSIQYRSLFNAPLPGRIASSEDPTYGVTAYIGTEGVFLGGDSGWYPEPAVQVKERLVTVTVPVGFEAITEGEQVSRRKEPPGIVSTWRVSVPGETLSLSAGPYHITERQLDGITVATYFYRDNLPLSGRYLDAVQKYLRLYQQLLGPYPFKKFAVVENFLPTGYGFPSYTLIGSPVIRLPFIVSTSLPHEIAHCWWGNGVRVDASQGNWSEGLATYLADYLLEEMNSAGGGREYRQRILTDYAALVPPEHDFPVRQFTGRVDPASRCIGYGKSAMVFHMIRQQIGDDAFFAALRTLFRERVNREASWADFTRAFSQASGKDLIPFMAQWLDRPGGPRLALKSVTAVQGGDGWRVSGFIEQGSPFYSLSVPLRLYTKTGPQTVDREFAIEGERVPFTVTIPDKPSRLELDPDSDIFRLLSPRVLPPTVNRVKGSRSLVVVETGGCRATTETLRFLVQALGQENAVMVREGELTGSLMKNRDMLLCGVPRQNHLLPRLPEEVSVTPRSFSVKDATFSSPSDALFVVGRREGEAERVAALFLPLSVSAAETSVPKITHYGKYGYLAFRDGENRKKGVVPPEGGESVVMFTEVHHE